MCVHLTVFCDISQLPAPALTCVGSGRRATLVTPINISEAVERVKSYLGLPHLRVAVGEGLHLGRYKLIGLDWFDIKFKHQMI